MEDNYNRRIFHPNFESYNIDNVDTQHLHCFLEQHPMDDENKTHVGDIQSDISHFRVQTLHLCCQKIQTKDR